MEDLEVTCSICDQEYSDDRTPRNLPCGHSICTLCVDEVLARDGKCPECRVPITAATSDDLPIGYTLLTLSCRLKKKREMQRKEVDSSSSQVEGSRQVDAGKCECHGFSLLFRCQTCDVWVCRDCVLEHPEPPRGTCRNATFATAQAEAQETYANAVRFENIMISLLKNELNAVKSHVLEQEKQYQTELSFFQERDNYIKRITDKITDLLKKLESWPDFLQSTEDRIAHAKTPYDLTIATHTSVSSSDYLKRLVIEIAELTKEIRFHDFVSKNWR
nr:tripartite motif-containing protein 65-like [Procambarus clarkii]